MKSTLTILFVLCFALGCEPKVPERAVVYDREFVRDGITTYVDPVEVHGKNIERSYTAKVTAITDGDTIKVLINSEEKKIRLESVDAPETKQPFGTKAKEALGELVAGKSVVIKETGKYRYGRVLAFIEVDGANVSEEMIKRGMSWYYIEYGMSLDLAILQDAAMESKIGLWGGSEEPIAPWDWRKIEREKRKADSSK